MASMIAAPAPTPVPTRPRVFVALPHYAALDVGVLWALLNAQWRAPGRYALDVFDAEGSALTANFNVCWEVALNLRDQGQIDYLILLHADEAIVEKDWLDVLLAERARVGADVLSVVLPIKSLKGLTSTARDTDPWRPTRYTMHQVLAGPVTWTEPDLLVSSGLLLVDFRKPWVEQICFRVRDEIARDPITGRWTARFAPEDWEFSRQARALGATVYATRVLKVFHVGPHPFPNFKAWGQLEDADNLAYAEARRAAQASAGALVEAR